MVLDDLLLFLNLRPLWSEDESENLLPLLGDNLREAPRKQSEVLLEWLGVTDSFDGVCG